MVIYYHIDGIIVPKDATILDDIEKINEEFLLDKNFKFNNGKNNSKHLHIYAEQHNLIHLCEYLDKNADRVGEAIFEIYTDEWDTPANETFPDKARIEICNGKFNIDLLETAFDSKWHNEHKEYDDGDLTEDFLLRNDFIKENKGEDVKYKFENEDGYAILWGDIDIPSILIYNRGSNIRYEAELTPIKKDDLLTLMRLCYFDVLFK